MKPGNRLRIMIGEKPADDYGDTDDFAKGGIAKRLMKAIKDGDEKIFVSAFREMVDACSMDSDSEEEEFMEEAV